MHMTAGNPKLEIGLERVPGLNLAKENLRTEMLVLEFAALKSLLY